MFGVDRESFAVTRAKNQLQYANELRRQIEEKNKIANPPRHFTTTNQDTYFLPNQQIQKNSTPRRYPRLLKSPENSHRNINHDFESNSIEPNLKWQDYSQQAGLHNRSNSTMIDKSLLHTIPTFSSSSFSPTSTLSTTSTLSKTTFTGFENSISFLDENVNETNKMINQTMNSSSILQEKIPEVNHSIYSIRDQIQNISASLPQITKHAAISAKNNLNLLEKAQILSNEIFFEIKQEQQYVSNDVNIFNQRIMEMKTTFHSDFINLKSHSSKNKQKENNSTARISKFRDRLNKAQDKVMEYGSTLDSLDKSTSNKFLMFQDTMNHNIKNATDHLSREIINESDERERLFHKNQLEISKIQNEVSNQLLKMSDETKHLNSSLKESIESTKLKISDLFTEINDRNEKYLNDLIDHYDYLIVSNEENFGNIQKETMNTITEIKNIVSESNQVIEDIILEEASTRQSNLKNINEKLNHFNRIILAEKESSEKKLNESFNKVKEEAINQLDFLLSPTRTEILGIEYQRRHLDETEQKILQYEEEMNQAKGKILSQVSVERENLKKLNDQFNENFYFIDNRLKELEERVGIVCQEYTNFSFIPRMEIRQLESEFYILTSSRLEEIERHIEQAVKYLGEINSCSPIHQTSNAAHILDNLVKNDSKPIHPETEVVKQFKSPSDSNGSSFKDHYLIQNENKILNEKERLNDKEIIYDEERPHENESQKEEIDLNKNEDIDSITYISPDRMSFLTQASNTYDSQSENPTLDSHPPSLSREQQQEEVQQEEEEEVQQPKQQEAQEEEEMQQQKVQQQKQQEAKEEEEMQEEEVQQQKQQEAKEEEEMQEEEVQQKEEEMQQQQEEEMQQQEEEMQQQEEEMQQEEEVQQQKQQEAQEEEEMQEVEEDSHQ